MSTPISLLCGSARAHSASGEMAKAAAETIFEREEAHSDDPAGTPCNLATPAVKPR
jgi:NAD(P)H-dependent FMN reductase